MAIDDLVKAIFLWMRANPNGHLLAMIRYAFHEAGEALVVLIRQSIRERRGFNQRRVQLDQFGQTRLGVRR